MSDNLEFGDVIALTPKAVEAMHALKAAAALPTLSPLLLELVKLRASQLNECGFCVHMHARDARAAGETHERLDMLSVWRESELFTPRERAALEWTEALTELAGTEQLAAVRAKVATELDETELVHLAWIVVHINGWNRIAKAFHFTPGTTARTRAAR